MINLKKIIFIIENITVKLGVKVSWLIFLMALTAFLVALLRYFFNIGYVWMQESYIWMHGLVFLLGTSYALLEDKHVRVDIFYRNFNEKYKAYVNLIFSIFFILPFIFIVSKYSIPYVLKSWISLEKSREAGGLHFLYIYKTSLILFCFFLLIQTIALILRCFLVITEKEKSIFFK
tara:strand:+ start:66 stop:593 length:528 start_codon:yes stop_codon:yes gene_type:complete